VLGSALFLVGCSATAPGSLQVPGPQVPPAWQGLPAAAGPVAATNLAQWWLRFNDPLLAELIGKAMLANSSVNTAQASLRQARALRDVAAAALWPQLGGTASVQNSKSGELTSTNALRAGMDASWELDFFGARRVARHAGELAVVASAASLGDTQVSIAAEVALAYLTLRNAQVRLAIAGINLDSQLHTLQIVEWRQRAGLVGALDAEQSRSAAEQTRALQPALRTAMVQSRHALAVLCGLAPTAIDDLLAPAARLPQVNDDLVLAIPADTLRQRPDVRAAEWSLRAAAARVDQAWAASLPSFSLGGTWGLGAATWVGLGSGAAVIRSVLASAAVPIFDGGAARAQVRAQQADHEKAHVAWRLTLLSALQEVEDALEALRGDRERSVYLAHAADAAGKAVQLALQSYQSGLVDYQRVLETQRNQLATQDSLASAEASLSANQVRLYKALGGGWSEAALAADLALGSSAPANPNFQTTPP
jgi:outer membrane protein, multidrug efflux system